jgi:electron transport complex protein RnfE
MNKKTKDALFGGILQNPVFVLVLGTCPTIAKSTNITDAMGLGLATAFVLICSNIFISLLRKTIPGEVRLPAFIVIIATFVTIVQLFMAKFLPDLNASIGAFIPLIVVNCIILGRAEAFASKNGVLLSALDGVSMGLGFTMALMLLGAIRQGLTALGLTMFGSSAGGFLIFGLVMAGFNFVIDKIRSYNYKKDTLDTLASTPMLIAEKEGE